MYVPRCIAIDDNSVTRPIFDEVYKCRHFQQILENSEDQLLYSAINKLIQGCKYVLVTYEFESCREAYDSIPHIQELCETNNSQLYVVMLLNTSHRPCQKSLMLWYYHMIRCEQALFFFIDLDVVEERIYSGLYTSVSDLEEYVGEILANLTSPSRFSESTIGIDLGRMAYRLRATNRHRFFFIHHMPFKSKYMKHSKLEDDMKTVLETCYALYSYCNPIEENSDDPIHYIFRMLTTNEKVYRVRTNRHISFSIVPHAIRSSCMAIRGDIVHFRRLLDQVKEFEPYMDPNLITYEVKETLMSF